MNVYLSIIIPVYKVEAYVSDCLKSVFRQLPEGVEVIVVDDGSPDQSMQIIRGEFQSWIQSGVLVLLSQENKGPGGARNLGVANSRGAYIGFLDSDDVLLDGYFNELMDRIKLGVADIIEFGFKRFTHLQSLESEPYKALYSIKGLKKLASIRDRIFATSRWFPSLRVYRRRYFEAFTFPDSVHYEDSMTIPFVYQQNVFVEFIGKPLLGYRERPGSITSRHTRAQLNQIYVFFQSMQSGESSAVNILKIRTARTLAYFYRELGATDFPMHAVIKEVDALTLSSTAQSCLEWPDWFLFKAPRLYMMVNALRIRNVAKSQEGTMTKDKRTDALGNIDQDTVASFGDEWARMDQGELSEAEKQAIFQDYFAIFPFQYLPETASGFDMGCGSGRWATLVASRVASLCCIDASPEALAVAKGNLREFSNVEFLTASVGQVDLPDGSFDFGYSLGVLHHVPDTQAAIASCAKLLKPNAPFLLYLYYALEDKPSWYKLIWKASELFRSVVNKMPSPMKAASANALAVLLYWPLAKVAHVFHLMGFDVDNFPLSYYKDKSFYTMRTDARDRFGTPLEKRFTKAEIADMLNNAGFERVRFSEHRPYWVALAYKAG